MFHYLCCGSNGSTMPGVLFVLCWVSNPGYWQALYHWAAFPDNRKDLRKIIKMWYFIESFVLFKRNKLNGANYFPYSLSAYKLQTSSSRHFCAAIDSFAYSFCLCYTEMVKSSQHMTHTINQFPEWALTYVLDQFLFLVSIFCNICVISHYISVTCLLVKHKILR